MRDQDASRWIEKASDYAALSDKSGLDSGYIQGVGLKPTLLSLIGDVSSKTLLDAGCGTGWLDREVKCKSAYSCDVVPPRSVPRGFSAQDVTALGFANESFDVVVCSMVLMWIRDLASGLQELRRVTVRSGRLIVALAHPYFYHTGHVLDDSSFVISRNLEEEYVDNEHHISGSVGPLSYYYRPYFTYVNALVGAGWELRRANDWFLDMDSYQAVHGSTSVKRTGKVPYFAFFELFAV